MVKHIDTTIALLTMEGVSANTSLADVAKIFKITSVEHYFVTDGLFVDNLSTICRINFGGNVP